MATRTQSRGAQPSPGISRIDQESTRTHGYFVRLGYSRTTDGSFEELAPTDSKLSKRQKQLIVMLDRGLSNREIADELGISEHTVKVHLWRLFRRLGVKSRTQTIHYARTHGMLTS